MFLRNKIGAQRGAEVAPESTRRVDGRAKLIGSSGPLAHCLMGGEHVGARITLGIGNGPGFGYHSMGTHHVGHGFHLGSDDLIDAVAILMIVGLAWSANSVPGFRTACQETAKYLTKPAVQAYNHSVGRLRPDAETRLGQPGFRIDYQRATNADSREMTGQAPLILVADQRRQSRLTAKKVLEENGYRVLVAPDGNSAVRTLQESPARIALVLLDASAGGEETVRQLQTIRHDLKIMLIQKPFRAEELSQKVRTAL